jgi:predicted nucleic acid-binding protein
MIEILAEKALEMSNKLNIPIYDAIQVMTAHLTQEEHNAVLRYIVSAH